MKMLLTKAAVVASFVAMVTVNALANILPINGVTTGAVSDGYPSFFVPAGYVFSIWGLIYLALLMFVMVQAFSRSLEVIVAPVRALFVLSCIANGAWILCWHHHQLALSVGVMLVMLVTLIVVYVRLRKSSGIAPSPWVRWTVLAPFGIYLAWICVATIANVSALLFSLGWQGAPLSGPWWAVIMMVIAAGIIARLAMTFRDALPPLVLAWALVGIVVKFPDQPMMRVVGLVLAVVMLGSSAMIRR